MDPQVQSGELQPASPELGVRRLFRLSRNNEHFAQLALRDRRTTEVAQWFCGADVKLVQSLALLKPPGTGEKRWHQDQGVFRIATAGDSIILGFWIALDRATPHNGCMHFWPHSQAKGIVKVGLDRVCVCYFDHVFAHCSTRIVCLAHKQQRRMQHGVPIPEEERGPGAHIYYSVLDVPPPEETVAVPLEPGDCLIFDVQTVHGTPSNTTAERRRSIQLQYASAASQPTRCPDAKERPDLTIIEEIGRVLKHDPSEEEILPREQRPVTQWYDCDDARTCTEPQHWSFRKAEALVCGRDYGPQFI